MSTAAPSDPKPSERIAQLERAVNRLLLPVVERLEADVKRLEEAATAADDEIKRLVEENERLLADNIALCRRPTTR
jgi:hypothetical protein